NAAVLSGIQEIFVSNASVEAIVKDILEKNHEKPVKPVIYPNGKVTVTLEKEVPLYFMRIFDIDSTSVEVTSSAIREPGKRELEMAGVVPLGVEEGTKLAVGTEYPLKSDNKIGQQGWFGYLDLTKYVGGNTGASDLKALIEEGCTDKIKVDYEIGKITGNKTSVGKDLTPKIVLIIIFKVIDSGNKESIKVTGFAYCRIRVDPNDDKTILGEFIKTLDVASESGTITDAIVNKIRLVE
ncbi:MAG: hypothetical protein N2B06_16435, partial [Clostridium sp.]